MKPLLFALLVAAAMPVPAQARLSGPEKAMLQAVDKEQERSISLLEKLVNQNSGSLNLAGVEAVGRMVRAELEPLGFAVQWVPMRETGRAGHIIATHKGNGRGKRMLLIGHLDTVFEPDSPFQRFVRKGDKAEGPGVDDDKGGMVVMIGALRAMQAAGTLKDATSRSSSPATRRIRARRSRSPGGTWSPPASGRTWRSISRGWLRRMARTWARSRAAAPAAGKCARPARQAIRAASSARAPATGRSTN
jgi:hypothetical protein